MKKITKGLSLVMATLMVITLSVGNARVANAITLDQDVKKAATQETMKINKAIDLLEKNYLIQNADGTTAINSEADNDKNIDPEILQKIKTASNQVNGMIKNGELEFDRNTKQLHESLHATPAAVTVYGTYIWHWYGFDFVMDAYNSSLFGAELARDAALLAMGAAIGGAIPGVTFVCGSSAAIIGYWGSIASQGGTNGRGSIAFFMGDPSWAQIYSVQGR